MSSRWLRRPRGLTFRRVRFLTANVAYSQTTGDIEGTVDRPERRPASRRLRRAQVAGASGHAHGRYGRRRPLPLPGAAVRHLHGDGGPLRLRQGREDEHPRRLGATATLPITMSVSVKEEIVVTGEAPVVDTTKTTIGMNATLESDPAAAARAELRLDRQHRGGNWNGRLRQRHGLRRDGPRELVHHRRRQHDRRQDRRPGQDAEQRVRPGGRGQDRRLRGRVRPRPRRHDQRRHEVRRQRVQGRRVRLLRPGSLAADDRAHRRADRREPGRVLRAEARRLRRGPRRLLRQGPPLVLRRVTTASTRTRTTMRTLAVPPRREQDAILDG